MSKSASSSAPPYPYCARLINLRSEKGESQKLIAEFLKIRPSTYADYEQGRIRIPIAACMALAKYYDVSIDYIAGTSNLRHRYPRC